MVTTGSGLIKELRLTTEKQLKNIQGKLLSNIVKRPPHPYRTGVLLGGWKRSGITGKLGTTKSFPLLYNDTPYAGYVITLPDALENALEETKM
mgnify:CR=1 FL=1|tara:strand:- start:5594 stop:5872 length:279 start_codon:yes stop_codon:yes gene_type:complete